MDDYSLFVDYSLSQCLKEDFSNKKKVRQNNQAANKLQKLQKKMLQGDFENTLARLLHHQDARVQINAAVLCYKANAFTNEAIQILRNIVANCDDPIVAFNAEMVLKEHFQIK